MHGIRGFVFDMESHAPLAGAVIYVHGIEHNVTTYRDGDFFRILTPGIYSITVQRLGYVEIMIDQMSLSFFFFFLRYQPETRVDIHVGYNSSTYVEFQLKRKDYSAEHSPSKIQNLYNKSKDFVLHRTLFLLIAGICGSYLPSL